MTAVAVREFTLPDSRIVPSVDLLEGAMAREPMRLTLEPVHHFAPGLYARELTIPEGTLLTGKIHRTAHLCVISSGDITVWTEGEPAKRLVAPCTFLSGPGARRVGYAHRETVWTTLHPTDETDLDRLEALLIEPHVNPYLPTAEERALCPGSR